MTWWVGLTDFKFSSSVQSGGRCVSAYMEQYLVRTDSPTFPTPQEIATAVGAVRGSPYAIDNNAICNSIEIGPGPVMTKVPFLAFTVTLNWATNAVLPADDDDDPTTTRVIWSIDPQIQSRHVIRDKNGVLIQNTAGQKVSVPVDVRLGSVTAQRKVDAAGYDKAAVVANCGKVNSTSYLGADAGDLQVDIKAKEHYEGAFHFWDEQYTFTYDPDGVQPKFLSAGTKQRASIGSNVIKDILKGDIGDTNNPSDPVDEDQPLDANGIMVPIASRPGGKFVTVDYFETMDFNTIGL